VSFELCKPMLQGGLSADSKKRHEYPEQLSASGSRHVLRHRRVDEAAAVSRISSVLAGGSLLLNLPAYAFMKSIHDRRVHNSRPYTATGAHGLVNEAGFHVVGSGYWNSLLFPPMRLHRLTTGRISAESDVRVFPPWLDRLCYAISRVKRRMANVGLRLPFGGSVWISAVKRERN
jgi:hypothetical protein